MNNEYLSWSAIGTGISGLITAILSVLHINSRIHDLDQEKQSKNACDALHKGLNGTLDRINEELNYIRQRIDYIVDNMRRKE